MSRVQLALNVTDLDAAVRFYEGLFGQQVTKRRPGYANFAIDEPALKLVLIEGEGPGGTLNHLGVEQPSTQDVTTAAGRIRDAGLDTTETERGDCCYARQDKFWVQDPDGAAWEIYTVLGDADVMAPTPLPVVEDAVSQPCC